MTIFDANKCMDAFCDFCESLIKRDLISLDECQYWVFEQGYKSSSASLEEFSQLCDMADRSELISAMDCQFWLFEGGHLAARKAFVSLTYSHYADLLSTEQSATMGSEFKLTN